MNRTAIEERSRASGFENVNEADHAVRQLLAAGFPNDQLVVVCAPELRDRLGHESSLTESPASSAVETVATGGVAGATLGGLALAATALAGGPVGAAALVFVGGGALAGVFGNLIGSKGYASEADDIYKQAVRRGLVVVGVQLSDDADPARIALAQRILDEAGGKPLRVL